MTGAHQHQRAVTGAPRLAVHDTHAPVQGVFSDTADTAWFAGGPWLQIWLLLWAATKEGRKGLTEAFNSAMKP